MRSSAEPQRKGGATKSPTEPCEQCIDTFLGPALDDNRARRRRDVGTFAGMQERRSVSVEVRHRDDAREDQRGGALAIDLDRPARAANRSDRMWRQDLKAF